jgi:hypothetical protein
VTDPVFGEIDFHVDAWDGTAPFVFGPAKTSAFRVHVWADDTGPDEIQRSTFEQIRSRYASLWPSIAETLSSLHPILKTIEAVENNLKPIVGCYMECETGDGHSDFELVYEFELEGEGIRGYFVRIVGWRIVEAFMAE